MIYNNFLYFQIDTLNKRSKAAENAFLLLYKQVLEIPGKIKFTISVKH